jgi:hypothetical protein
VQKIVRILNSRPEFATWAIHFPKELSIIVFCEDEKSIWIRYLSLPNNSEKLIEFQPINLTWTWIDEKELSE